jgi:hypothetical protein
MTGELYKLGEGKVAGEPVENVIGFLEDILKRARAGEILAVSVCSVEEGGVLGGGACVNGYWPQLVAGLEAQKLRLVTMD